MKTFKWFLLLAAIMIVLPACALMSQGSNVPALAPSATPLPPTPVPPSPTAVVIVVTSTPAPTDTPLPVPTDTKAPPPPTNPPAPTRTPVPALATVIMYNGLIKTINVDLNGPDKKHFSIQSKGTKEFTVQPGTYGYTIIASGFYPLNGTITFKPGTNTWDIGKAKP